MLKEINNYFKTILRSEFEEISAEMLLTDAEKEMLRLRYVVKLDYQLIADILTMREKDVKNRLVIIRKKLAKLPIFTKEKFVADTATEYAIRERCRKLGKSKEYTEFCIDAFVLKMTRKQMAQKYHLEPDTIKKYKSNRRKELET